MNLNDLADKLNGKYYGYYVMARCIFHDDETPSMMVFEDGYRCLACGARGSLEKLL